MHARYVGDDAQELGDSEKRLTSRAYWTDPLAWYFWGYMKVTGFHRFFSASLNDIQYRNQLFLGQCMCGQVLEAIRARHVSKVSSNKLRLRNTKVGAERFDYVVTTSHA